MRMRTATIKRRRIRLCSWTRMATERAPPSALRAPSPASQGKEERSFSLPPLAGEGAEGGRGEALSRLLAWTSPSYPTGAFSYSHGLEWAVEEGSVHDVATLVDY